MLHQCLLLCFTINSCCGVDEQLLPLHVCLAGQHLLLCQQHIESASRLLLHPVVMVTLLIRKRLFVGAMSRLQTLSRHFFPTHITYRCQLTKFQFQCISSCHKTVIVLLLP